MQMISKTKPKPESTDHITVSILKGLGGRLGVAVVELGSTTDKSEKYKCLSFGLFIRLLKYQNVWSALTHKKSLLYSQSLNRIYKNYEVSKK